jgi:hypothetical protein
MRRQIALMVVAAAALAMTVPAVDAALTSKHYEYKSGVKLTTDVELGEGLKLDSVMFLTPSSVGKGFWKSGLLKAEVAISNFGQAARKLGIVIALFDDNERLLGVATHGTTFPLKPERQAVYTLEFTNVNSEVFKATKFTISVEPKY